MTEGSEYVYFARPIDFFGETAASIQFQSQLEQVLAEAGYSVYHPAYAWKVNGPLTADLARCIDSTNRFALRRAAAMVAWLPEGVQTQGVPMEIEFASRELGLPVIVLGSVGASVMGNTMVSVLPEDALDRVGRQLDLMIPDFTARNNPTVRYSAPTELVHAHPGDAGVDLRASADIRIPPGQSRLIPTGVRIRIPSTMFGWIVARSSAWQRHGLQVLPGVIDSGYQGELHVNALNSTHLPVSVHAGESVAQMLLLANMWPGFHLDRTEDEHEVHPTPSSRGANGFGSSGR